MLFILAESYQKLISLMEFTVHMLHLNRKYFFTLVPLFHFERKSIILYNKYYYVYM